MYGGQKQETNDTHQIELLTDSNGNLFYGCTSRSSQISGNKLEPNCGFDTAKSTDFWFLKLDSNGDKIWEQTYGGKDNEELIQVISDTHNGFFLYGMSNSKPACEKTTTRYSAKPDMWLMHVDNNGLPLWDKRYGNIYEDYASSVTLTADNNIIINGVGYDVGGDITDSIIGDIDGWIAKGDSVGNLIWNQRYGGTLWDGFNAVIPLSISTYLLVGTTASDIGGDVSTPWFSPIRLDNWLVKIDSMGNKIWDKRYGCFAADDYPEATLLNSNGEVVIGSGLGLSGNLIPCNDGSPTDTSARGSYDCWIYKIDTATGNILADKRFGGNKSDDIIQIVEMPDKGYLLACISSSDAGFEKTEPRIGTSIYGWGDWWIVRMDSAFNILWDKTIGGDNEERSPSIIAIDDSTFIIAGISYSDTGYYKQVPAYDTATWIQSDVWICKFAIANSNSIEEINAKSYNLFPNPAVDVVYITPNIAAGKLLDIEVYDINGSLVYSEHRNYTNTTIPIYVGALRSGVYIVAVNGVRKKMIKM